MWLWTTYWTCMFLESVPESFPHLIPLMNVYLRCKGPVVGSNSFLFDDCGVIICALNSSQWRDSCCTRNPMIGILHRHIISFQCYPTRISVCICLLSHWPQCDSCFDLCKFIFWIMAQVTIVGSDSFLFDDCVVILCTTSHPLRWTLLMKRKLIYKEPNDGHPS